MKKLLCATLVLLMLAFVPMTQAEEVQGMSAQPDEGILLQPAQMNLLQLVWFHASLFLFMLHYSDSDGGTGGCGC